MIKNIVFDFGGVLVQYDFKAFFAKQLGSEEQAEWFMQHILNEENNNLIDKEDKRAPLSHDTLAEKMKELGFPVARRTIAKYRDRLGIPVARLRR